MSDALLIEKLKNNNDILDEKIKSEELKISIMNSRQKSFMRLDVVQKEVDVE